MKISSLACVWGILLYTSTAWASSSATGKPLAAGIPYLLWRTADTLAFYWMPPASDNGNPITGYTVQRHAEMGSWTGECRQQTGVVCVVRGLSPDSNHIFRVRALNSAGRGRWSQETTFSTLPQTQPQGDHRCVSDSFSACLLGERFAVSLHWRDAQADGRGVVQAADNQMAEFETGQYPQHEKILIRMTDACQLSGYFSLDILTLLDSRLSWSVRVLDTSTGAVKEYFSHPSGHIKPVYDKRAFATCEND